MTKINFEPTLQEKTILDGIQKILEENDFEECIKIVFPNNKAFQIIRQYPGERVIK